MNDTEPTTPASGRNRVDMAHRRLLERIRSGALSDGDKLASENILAAEIGVSRPVIREAIARLAAAGLVRTVRGHGSYVQSATAMPSMTFAPITSVDDLLAWQELRIAIEQEAGRLAALRRSDDDLRRIEAANDALLHEDGIDTHGGELDHAFHVAIACATHNKAIVEAQRSLGNHTKQWVSAVLHTGKDRTAERNEYRLREHQAIIDAITRMDPEGAANAIRRHIENGRTRFLARMSRHSGTVSVDEG